MERRLQSIESPRQPNVSAAIFMGSLPACWNFFSNAAYQTPPGVSEIKT
jgi:hypothetical protein